MKSSWEGGRVGYGARLRLNLDPVSWWGNPREFESRPSQYFCTSSLPLRVLLALGWWKAGEKWGSGVQRFRGGSCMFLGISLGIEILSLPHGIHHPSSTINRMVYESP